MIRVAVVDYGLGNLPSVTKALERVGASTLLIDEPAALEAAIDAVVLPGVGHFGAGARNLSERGFVEPLQEWAASGRPLLGICLGLQLLLERSEEDPDVPGLGIVKGDVRRLKAPKVPHMGWNTLEVRADARVLGALRPGDMAYFVHSYYVDPDPGLAVATTSYGQDFCSAIEHENVVGVQFHPEKSAEVGRRLLSRFLAEAG